MKTRKILVSTFATIATAGLLAGCSWDGLPFTSDQTTIFGSQVASAAALVKLASPTSSTPAQAVGAPEATADLTVILAQVDTLLATEELLTVTDLTSDRSEYAYHQELKLSDLTGTPITYNLYFNDVARGEDLDFDDEYTENFAENNHYLEDYDYEHGHEWHDWEDNQDESEDQVTESETVETSTEPTTDTPTTIAAMHGTSDGEMGNHQGKMDEKVFHKYQGIVVIEENEFRFVSMLREKTEMDDGETELKSKQRYVIFTGETSFVQVEHMIKSETEDGVTESKEMFAYWVVKEGQTELAYQVIIKDDADDDHGMQNAVKIIANNEMFQIVQVSRDGEIYFHVLQVNLLDETATVSAIYQKVIDDTTDPVTVTYVLVSNQTA